MSSIGLLPIMFALTAFAFLWGMVNYNGLLKLQRNIRKAEELLKIHREKMILFLENDLKGKEQKSGILSKIQEAVEVWKVKFELKQEQKLLTLLSEYQRYLKTREGEHNNNLDKLQTALTKTHSYYRMQTLQYNSFIKKMPSKLIANWFKFEEIRLT